MRKIQPAKKPMNLTIETVRALDDHALAATTGGQRGTGATKACPTIAGGG